MIEFKESPLLVTLQILNKKWTIEIIMELMKGRKRFSDLLSLDSSLTSKVLSERLKELHNEGIIEKIVINIIPLKVKYQITEKGRLLKRIFFEMALFSCIFYPEKVFKSQNQNDEFIIRELLNIFKVEDIDFEEIRRNYF